MRWREDEKEKVGHETEEEFQIDMMKGKKKTISCNLTINQACMSLGEGA